jgi:hypothetical protein
VHHGRARRYWQDQAAELVAFCRVTALALLRHLTNSRIMQHAVLTGSNATGEAGSLTGNFYTDEQVLAAAGVTDFSAYSLGAPEGRLVPDIFL